MYFSLAEIVVSIWIWLNCFYKMLIQMVLLGPLHPAITWSYLSMCHHEHIFVNGKLSWMIGSWNLFSILATDWLPLWSSLPNFSACFFGLQCKWADVKHICFKTAVFKSLSIIMGDCYPSSLEAVGKVSYIFPFLAEVT